MLIPSITLTCEPPSMQTQIQVCFTRPKFGMFKLYDHFKAFILVLLVHKNTEYEIQNKLFIYTHERSIWTLIKYN